jgi:hypothetical protein
MLAFLLGFVTCYAIMVTAYVYLYDQKLRRSNARYNHPTNW